MASSSGSGFTASIVNGIANYVSSDLSNLGMKDGVTGSIQYVKMLWGASGEANLISDDPVDPSSLPVSLNTPENKFLTDALINGMNYADGITAFSVRILDASGISLGAVSIELGAGMTIVGFGDGISNANLGVTFGSVNMSGGFLPVTNRIIGGVTQSIQVTGGMFILGGTVAVSGLDIGSLNLDLSGGITINGMTGSNKLGVTFSAATITGTVDTHIKSIQAGVTFPMVLTKSDGTFLGIGSGGSLMVSGVLGATAIGVTFSGNIGTTFGGITGSVNIIGQPSVTGSVHILGTPTVAISPTTNTVKIDSVTNTVKIDSVTNTVKIDSTTNTVKIQPNTTGTTFGVVFTNTSGTALGQSGGVVVGLPVFGVSGATAINVMIVGGLSGITITGLAFPSFFGVSGGTLAVSGGTIDYIGRIGSISGGTINVGNTVGIMGSVSINNLPATQNVTVVNVTAIETLSKAGFVDTEGTSLKDHLTGLSVSTSGGGGGGLGNVTELSGISMGFTSGDGSANGGMAGITGIGVTFARIAVGTMPAVSVFGSASTRGANPTAAVGVELSGKLFGLSAFGNALGVSLAGVGLSGDALKVSIVGGLSGITITGFAFPSSFAVSGGTLSGGTLDHIRTIGFINGGTIDHIKTIGSISGGTFNIGNTVTIGGTVGIGNISSGIVFKSNLTDSSGNVLTNEKGIPVFGLSGATAIGVTWSGTPTFGISGNVSVQQATGTTFGVVFTNTSGTALGQSGGIVVGLPVFGLAGATAIGVTGTVAIQQATGTTFGVVFTNNFGVALGLSGATVVGMPVFGVSGATAIGVTFAGISIVGTVATTASLSLPPGGLTVVFANNFGTALGLSGATVVGMPVFGLAGATAINVALTNNFGAALGLSGATVVGMPVFGLAGATAINVALTNNFGAALGMSGATVVGMPVFGLAGATALRVTLTNNFGAALGISGATVVGMPVFGLAGATAINVALTNNFGAALGMSGATVVGMPVFGLAGATALRVTLTNNFGAALGMSGATVVGMPVFGLAGATAIGVTFGAITFGSAGMGVTFSGITFNTTRTIITGTSFAGMPVFGVMGATAVEVKIMGGTISGIFTTEPEGITVTLIPGGIPVFGMQGATAIGVTFSGGNIGTTFGGITGSVNIIGQPSVTGSVHILGIAAVSVSSGEITSITNTVAVKPDDAFRNTDLTTIMAGRTASGFIVTEKTGNNFSRGLTLDSNFIGSATVPSSLQWGNTAGGNTVFFLKSSPVSITKDYLGDARFGTLSTGETSVPLKVGLYIQLTKWDLISHVLVGYTAGTTQEFARNAQVLSREYQVAPIWGNAIEQFRRYAGASGNSSTMTDVDVGDPANLNDPPMVQKQFVGVIEKPTRLFIPCTNAGNIYIQVIGDYRNHAIGSGFWSYEGATAGYSEHTLYERGFFASDVAGFRGYQAGDSTGGEPSMNVQGNFEGVDDFLSNTEGSKAIQRIINGYKFNPFIRVWGH